MRTSLITLALLLAAATPAQASFPGANGSLVLALDDGSCEVGANLFTASPGGRALTRITDVCAGSEDEASANTIQAPEAAPKGRRLLAYTNTVPSGVVTLASDGGGVTAVAVPEGVRGSLSGSPALSFAPGGRSFVAQANNGPLYEVFLNGSPARVIRSTGRLFNPRVSPDGRLIAAVRPSGLWLFSFRTGKAVRRVVRRKNIADLDWSPNGRRLVYATGYQQREVEGGAAGGNLFVVGRDGKRHRTLVHREDIAETQPTWSPDGRSIAWVSLGFSAGDVSFNVFPSLWRVSLKTGKRTRLRRLRQPFVEEGFFHAPELSWLAR